MYLVQKDVPIIYLPSHRSHRHYPSWLLLLLLHNDDLLRPQSSAGCPSQPQSECTSRTANGILGRIIPMILIHETNGPGPSSHADANELDDVGPSCLQFQYPARTPSPASILHCLRGATKCNADATDAAYASRPILPPRRPDASTNGCTGCWRLGCPTSRPARNARHSACPWRYGRP